MNLLERIRKAEAEYKPIISFTVDLTEAQAVEAVKRVFQDYDNPLSQDLNITEITQLLGITPNQANRTLVANAMKAKGIKNAPKYAGGKWSVIIRSKE